MTDHDRLAPSAGEAPEPLAWRCSCGDVTYYVTTPEQAVGVFEGATTDNVVHRVGHPCFNTEDGTDASAHGKTATPRMSDDICICGHSRYQHIYYEGACRPGYKCQQGCDRFRADVESSAEPQNEFARRHHRDKALLAAEDDAGAEPWLTLVHAAERIFDTERKRTDSISFALRAALTHVARKVSTDSAGTTAYKMAPHQVKRLERIGSYVDDTQHSLASVEQDLALIALAVKDALREVKLADGTTAEAQS